MPETQQVQQEEGNLIDTLLDLIIPTLMLLFLWSCPYTKVEESFNMQATHDFLEYQTDLSKFDHVLYPGVVPRTCLGSIMLAAISFPYKQLVKSKFVLQLVVRSVLGLFNAFALINIKNAVARNISRKVARWFIIVSAVQFHVLFWSTRTLPNMFAFGLVNLALAEWIDLTGPTYNEFVPQPNSSIQVRTKRAADRVVAHSWMIWLLVLACVIFRLEVALFAGPLVITFWIFQDGMSESDAWNFLVDGLFALIFSLALTVGVDSWFWNPRLHEWIWPEFQGFLYNAVEGKSKNWGVSPRWFYFTNLLPRITMSALPLAMMGAAMSKRMRLYLLPCFLFMLSFSMLEHKEWRFIIYIVPLFNIAAAFALAKLQNNSDIFLVRLVFWGALAGLALNFVITLFTFHISTFNYPGGVALENLHKLEADKTNVYVHMDSGSCQTGITRFGELRNDWIYSKNETHKDAYDYLVAGYTHLITTDPSFHQHSKFWEVLSAVEGIESIRAYRPRELLDSWKAGLESRELGMFFPVEVVIHPAVTILKRFDYEKKDRPFTKFT